MNISTTATAGCREDKQASQREQDPHSQGFDDKRVVLVIVVKETMRKLCTVRLPATATMEDIKQQILEKNRRLMAKNLFVTLDQCSTSMMRLSRGCREIDGNPTLQEL